MSGGVRERGAPPHVCGPFAPPPRRGSARHRTTVERNYRMAYCATVSLHDDQGRTLHTICYGRMPPTPGSLEAATHREIHRLMERLRDDVRALCTKRPELAVALLADGAPELWGLFERHLNERTSGVTPVQLVDAWHALLRAAARARALGLRSLRRSP